MYKQDSMKVASIRHKVLVICPQRQMMAEIVPLLSSTVPLAPVQKLATFPDKKQIAEALAGFDAKLCFVDFSSNGAGSFQTLEILQAVAPQIAVIALLTGNNPELVLNCLRAGAAAFAVHPFTPDQIEGAVETAVRRLPATEDAATHARVIGVMPAKGAAGATTVACNLAWQCKRQGAERVLLCDLDSMTGTLSFLLKLKSSFSFVDVLHRGGAVDDGIWKQMMTRISGIDVLLAPESVVDPVADLMSPGALAEFAGSRYDVIVLDMGGPCGAWNVSVAQMCDELLLVCSNELASLHAAQRAILYLEAHNVSRERIKVVTNRYVKDAGLHADRIAEAIGVDVAHVIPGDPDSVAKSLMDGKPIPHTTAFGKSVSALALQLVHREPKTPKTEKTAKTAGAGLLSSLFSRS
jgi:pilus assembly protein CpaE